MRCKGFHSAAALKWLFEQDSTPAVGWLIQTPPGQIVRLRSYQRKCILAVEKEIIAGRRDLMVAIATGTGKTFVTVAQIYRLLESKLVRKILFLVDRKGLAAQAVREFNPFNTPKGNKFTQEYEVTLADQIEARFTKAKQYIDSLNQSILAKAFRGELVPQDPNDEPATLLIERIREARATHQTSAMSLAVSECGWMMGARMSLVQVKYRCCLQDMMHG